MTIPYITKMCLITYYKPLFPVVHIFIAVNKTEHGIRCGKTLAQVGHIGECIHTSVFCFRQVWLNPIDTITWYTYTFASVLSYGHCKAPFCSDAHSILKDPHFVHPRIFSFMHIDSNACIECCAQELQTLNSCRLNLISFHWCMIWFSFSALYVIVQNEAV
jgi:hypothetical protein